MKLRRLGLTVVLSFAILASPIAVEAQRAEKVPRVGVLVDTGPPPA